MQKREKVFNCYSPNLASFLKEKGIKPLGTETHDSGLFLWVNKGKEKGSWERCYNPYLANEKYPEIDVETIKRARNEAISSKSTVEIVNEENGEVYAVVKRRLHKFETFEQNDELTKALVTWKETKHS